MGMTGLTVRNAVTVTEYDLAEQEALMQLPNAVTRAFQPVVFQEGGYPFRIHQESELIKYVDVMHELQLERVFANLLQGFTEEEFALVRRLTRLVSQFGELRFQRRTLAKASLLRSLYIFRQIRYLFGASPVRVFEFGPGCGYLGALCLLEGYPYAATDVAQAFYLYQSALWDFLADGKLTELAADDAADTSEALAAVEGRTVAHVPWWRFATLRPEPGSWFDVVVCNHALCEMDLEGLRFNVKCARAFLQPQEGQHPVFLFEGWGQHRLARGTVTECFYRAGFVLIHHDRRLTMFAPCDTTPGKHGLALPHQRKCLSMRNWLRRAMGEDHLPEWSYEPPEYHSPHSPLSRARVASRQAQRSARTVGIEQVKRFYIQLLGTNAYLNPDEEFLAYARG